MMYNFNHIKPIIEEFNIFHREKCRCPCTSFKSCATIRPLQTTTTSILFLRLTVVRQCRRHFDVDKYTRVQQRHTDTTHAHIATSSKNRPEAWARALCNYFDIIIVICSLKTINCRGKVYRIDFFAVSINRSMDTMYPIANTSMFYASKTVYVEPCTYTDIGGSRSIPLPPPPSHVHIYIYILNI